MPVRMAESGSTPCAGDKRPADCKAEKRPPKVRRFDMKTKVPKAHTIDSAFSASSETRDGVGGSEKSIVITAVVKKSDSSRTVCDAGALTTERVAEASQRLQSTDKSDVSSHGAHKTQPSGSAPEAMSVNRMLQTSLGLPQTEMGSGHKEERSQGSYHKNIVDQLFQEFVSTKMREVDDRLNATSGEDSTKVESEKNPVSDSIEEMSRLLDAEITSIKSRNVVANLAVEDVVWSGFTDSGKTQVDHHSMDQSGSMFAVPHVSDRAWDSGSEQSQPPASTLNVVEVSAEAAADAGVMPGEADSKEISGWCGGEGAGLLVRKKLEVKKLGLSIRPESLARITGHANNGRTLEDGEVASSTDSDGEKAFLKTEQAVVAETEDSDEVSGTGSLSDSDRGKDSKAKKKKKKHKHKHKKKKKHKSQSKEKEKEEEEEKSSTRSKERRSSKDKKERKESPEEKSERKSSKERKEGDDSSKKDSKESKSKDRKKSSRQKSKSPEAFDPWDARNYRMEGSKARSPSPSKSRHRSRSQDRQADKSKDRSRQRSKERHHRKHSSHSREHSRKRSRSKEKEKGAPEGESAQDKDLRVKIDKNKLRKIAIARALANMEKGKGPSVDLTLAKSGGKSVAELTEFCKRISEKETTKESSESEASEEDKSDTEDSPFHHPFIMRESSAPIVMNIRNAKQLPVLTPQEKQTQAATLRTQFPVSSGTQHRSKESEWVPVTTTTTTTTIAGKATPANATGSSAGMTTTTVGSATGTMTTVGGGGAQTEIPMLPAPAAAAAAAAAAAVPAVESVFPSVQADISIGSIILERVQAMRRLQQNPFDLQALNSVHRINEQTNAWAQSRNLPGQFTGTTDIKILTQEELAGPDRRNQAWARKDQFRNAPPVQSGIGMHLLQKMGWKPGDGLGKDNEGNKEPLMLDIKTDRKGLSTSLDHRPMQPMMRPPAPGIRPPVSGNGPGIFPGAVAPFPQRAKDLSGKHPVSALTELCTKRRWGPPAFEVVTETGPAHKRMFLFKVRVNGVEYQPTAACGNKKLAKAQSAAVCLQEMGLIPRDFVVQV